MKKSFKKSFRYRKGRRFRRPWSRMFSYRRTPILLLLLGIFAFGWHILATQGVRDIPAKVVSVHDGDTIRVKLSPDAKKTHSVRILDIDCFEVPSKYSSKQVARQRKRFYLTQEEVYERGRKARELLASWIEEQNGYVTLKVPKKRSKDVYGRILAKVKVGEKDVSTELMKTSYCFKYRDPRSSSFL